MSLTSTQRDQARYKGSADIRTRKSYLKRSATAIRQLAEESTKDWSALHGLFTDKELNVIRAAGLLVDRATARLSVDILEADRIRAQYERDVALAHNHLDALPHTDIADIIALAAADNMAPGPMEMESLRYTRWLRESLNDMARNAINDLARTGARRGRNPAEFAAEIAYALPALKTGYAAMITELNTLAVAQQMEKTA